MKRILLDQNLPRRTAALLRSIGWDALHVSEANLTHARDPEIIQWASGENRVCVTRDADFHALLALSKAAKPSVVRIRIEPLTFEQAAETVQRVWDRFEDALDRGAVVTVTSTKMRARGLPLKQ